MSNPKRQVINVHEGREDWDWVRLMLPPQEAAQFDWRNYSTFTPGTLGKILKTQHFGRLRSGLRTRFTTQGRPQDLIIAHGPRPAFYTALLTGAAKRDATFVGMSFNYTDLPTGLSHKQMIKSYRWIDRFAVYSRMERRLYADYFDLPEERFDFIRWAVDPPITAPGPRTIDGHYAMALGSEARDYATLAEAARLVPNCRIILVARPHNIVGLSFPANVDVMTDLTWDACWTLMYHSVGSLIPLRSSTTPNGHRTLVGAQMLGKVNVITDSSGIRDYVEDGETGLLVPANDACAFATAIERLFDEPDVMARIGEAAWSFSMRECTPHIHVDYFRTVAGLA